MTEVHHDTRIHSSELAHHIGYAEYPHVEMANAALRVGLEDDHQKYLSDAEVAGFDASNEYLKVVSNDLANYALKNNFPIDGQVPAVEVLPARDEKYPGVRITKDQMIEYAEEYNVAGSSSETNSRGHTVNPNANKVGILWASFSDLKYDLSRKQKPDANWYRRTAPLIELEMDIETQEGVNMPNRLLSVSMDTLVNLLDEFDKAKALYPSKSTGQILGTGFGDSKLAFLREFVEYKKAQLAEEQAE